MRRPSLLVPVIVIVASCRGPAPRSTPHATEIDASAAEAEPAETDAGALDHDAICALDAGAAGRVHGGASAAPPEPHCKDSLCDTVDEPPDPKDTCFVAQSNLARAERESRSAPRYSAPAIGAWDRRSAPRFADRVDAHVHFTDAEDALLRKNGFVVLDRLGYASYAVAYHDVFQQQLPVFVSADSILNAVYQASQMLLMSIEQKRLAPRLVSMLARMHATLAASRGRYAAETIEDLDLYLTVARKLLGVPLPPRSGGVEAAAQALADQATAGTELAGVELFGRARMIDFTQYTPRGYYADTGFGPRIDVGATVSITLDQYFRAMTWLSRLELNLVSRSCRSSQPGETADPSETPREARDAVALADLAVRAGALEDLRAFETTYSVFAGRREDVSVPDLLAMRIPPNAPDAQKRLAAAIGDRFERTARTHYMPEGVTDLPAIATLFGPRIVPDVAPLTRLVHDSVPDRMHLGFADVAFVLGHDRARGYLEKDLAEFPALGAALAGARRELASNARAGKSVYNAWMGATLRLADAPEGHTPSFMRTDAYADMRMSSALAAYAQIRHTYVLLAGQGYDAYGCEIPDGFVEPAVGVYDGLLAWSRAARLAAPGEAAYFDRFDPVIAMLRGIAQTELSGAPLSEPQRRWLGMVAEFVPVGGYGGDSGEPPKYTGWYFDLFPDREHGAERDVRLVADYFTLTNADEVKYLGIEKAALGAFVVDVGGAPRMMIGPVAKPYEATSPIAKRFDDAAAHDAPKHAPWLGYVAPEEKGPELDAQLVECERDTRVVVTSAKRLGAVSVELLDHHGDALTDTVTRDVDRAHAVFAFGLPNHRARAGDGGRASSVEGLHVHVAKPKHDLVVSPSAYASGDELAHGRSALGILYPKGP